MSSIQGFGIQVPMKCKNRFQATTISLLEAKAGKRDKGELLLIDDDTGFA
jgi:hypothetical protein